MKIKVGDLIWTKSGMVYAIVHVDDSRRKVHCTKLKDEVHLLTYSELAEKIKRGDRIIGVGDEHRLMFLEQFVLQ